MNLSVILCTHNRASSLRDTLRSLAGVRVPAGFEWELIVVDNASTDETRAVVTAAATDLPCRYLFEPRQGKSFALNTGVPAASGEIIAFTDDDVTFHADWLGALWRAFETHACDAVGGRIIPVWSRPRPRWYSDAGPYQVMAGVVVDYDRGDETREIKMLPFGANMAFRRDVFTRYGLFRTDLGPNGQRLMRGEDTELCQRVRSGGGHILYVADAIVYHPVDETRLRKRYFDAWYFQYGRKEVLLGPFGGRTVRWFGIPRFLFRDLATIVVQWLFSLEPKQRFYHRLECWRQLGRIAEYRRPTHLTGPS